MAVPQVKFAHMLLTQVTLSARGKVNYLSGTIEDQIALLARGHGGVGITSSICKDHSEDGFSETNGEFSLQGLKPSCTYKIEAMQNSDDFIIGGPSFTMSEKDHDVGNVLITKKNTAFTLGLLIKTNYNQHTTMVAVEIHFPSATSRDYILPTHTLNYFDLLPKSAANYTIRIGSIDFSISDEGENFKYLEVILESHNLLVPHSNKTSNQSRILQYILPIVVICISIVILGIFFRNK